MQFAVVQDLCAETASALEEFLCPGRDGAIHPVTRRGFLRSVEPDTLNFKILADQAVELDATREDIAPDRAGRAMMNSKRGAQLLKNLERKKCDLPLVILFEIEVPVAANAPAGDAFDAHDLNRRMRVGYAFVMPDKIVPGRNVEVTDFHQPIITWEAARPNEWE